MNLQEYFKKLNINSVSRYFITRRLIFLDKYLKNKKGSSLDIGCAFGIFTEFMKKKGFDSYGIDMDKNLIGFAKEHGTAKYKYHAAENLPFKDNKFDVVLLFAVLEHVVDRGNALREINRVLKKDGIAIIIVPNTWSYFYFRSLVTFALRGKKAWKNVHYQQNYFYWEHLLNNYLRIKDVRPVLSIPFFEPKLIKNSRLAKFEYDKRNLAWLSAEPIFICTKRKNPPKGDPDVTNLS